MHFLAVRIIVQLSTAEQPAGSSCNEGITLMRRRMIVSQAERPKEPIDAPLVPTDMCDNTIAICRVSKNIAIDDNGQDRVWYRGRGWQKNLLKVLRHVCVLGMELQ